MLSSAAKVYWNDDTRMNEYTPLAENMSHLQFVHHKLTWNGLGVSLSHQVKRSATNKLSHSMATEETSPLSGCY
jgi:hypothetical protein